MLARFLARHHAGRRLDYVELDSVPAGDHLEGDPILIKPGPRQEATQPKATVIEHLRPERLHVANHDVIQRVLRYVARLDRPVSPSGPDRKASRRAGRTSANQGGLFDLDPTPSDAA